MTMEDLRYHKSSNSNQTQFKNLELIGGASLLREMRVRNYSRVRQNFSVDFSESCYLIIYDLVSVSAETEKFTFGLFK